MRLPGDTKMKIQLEIEGETGRQLFDWIRVNTGCESYKDVLNNAISLFCWAIQQRQKGLIIASLDERKKAYTELMMPTLEHCREEFRLSSEARAFVKAAVASVE